MFFKEFSERKNNINDVKNKLESELNFNISNLFRNSGTKILLVNSNFMLFHLNTMKYLTLNMKNQDHPKYYLVLLRY